MTSKETFADVQALIVDEIHAFAGDDRGWHRQGVLDRLTALAGRAIQRVGLSATVGNPDELLAWLQGANAQWGRPGVLIAPPASELATPERQLDHVGSVPNAATVIDAILLAALAERAERDHVSRPEATRATIRAYA